MGAVSGKGAEGEAGILGNDGSIGDAVDDLHVDAITMGVITGSAVHAGIIQPSFHWFQFWMVNDGTNEADSLREAC